MTALLINGLSIFMLILFGAMALFPLFLGDRQTEYTVEPAHEDVVLHVSPAPMIEQPMPAPMQQPVALGMARSDADPTRREAA